MRYSKTLLIGCSLIFIVGVLGEVFTEWQGLSRGIAFLGGGATSLLLGAHCGKLRSLHIRDR